MPKAWEEGRDLGSWSPRFSRHLNDSEIGEVETLFFKLQHLVVRREVEDILSWSESKNDKFSIRSLYCSYSGASIDSFPCSIIWRS